MGETFMEGSNTFAEGENLELAFIATRKWMSLIEVVELVLVNHP